MTKPEPTTRGTACFEIDLARSRAPRAYRGVQNLWSEDLQRIYRLVRRQARLVRLERGPRRRKGEDEELPHLAVAIFGPSGSGKSSLLRTLEDSAGYLESTSIGVVVEGLLRSPSSPDDSQRPADREDRTGRVVSLPVMDPTTWRTTDQFLYAFLASALEAERIRRSEMDGSYPRGLSNVQLKYQEVNEYLRVVDDPDLAGENDPLGLSMQKLERHTGSLRLRSALARFLDALAEDLRCDLILLPVDDLDMAPSHLVDALQTYQSFLMHPRLVPVFTFTDCMPEELIEAYFNQQLATTDAALFEDGRLSIAQQLSVQFLARCFPVRNRIRLGPAPARLQRALYRVASNRKGEEESVGSVLGLLTTSSFLLFGHPDAEDAHEVRAALRPSTLRRQFQVVDAMEDCRMRCFQSPQLEAFADPRLLDDRVRPLISELSLPTWGPERWEAWFRTRGKNSSGQQGCRLADLWMPGDRRRSVEAQRRPNDPPATQANDPAPLEAAYVTTAARLRAEGIEATWGSLFNGATWSLLNVHRDTLRELGLYLEDLYSWSPKELRAVVLDRILARDRVTRHTLVERWFNRTDYRRNQVLSLLAANAFRPWMPGEEPYGDEVDAIHRRLERERDTGHSPSLDGLPPDHEDQVRRRLTFPATQGLLWFLNVTLGFYLPQVLARNWSDATSSDEPVRMRMSGNGWDLRHAPVNSARIADARHESFSFGMLFLDRKQYAQKLRDLRNPEEDEDRGTPLRKELLLRIWTCYGFSRGRFWAAFSLWRGLSFIGQALELYLRTEGGGDRESRGFAETCDREPGETTAGEDRRENGKCGCRAGKRRGLVTELARLVRSHCLAGQMPGSLLDRGSEEEVVRFAFPRWDPHDSDVEKAICELAEHLAAWLRICRDDRIFPMPSGRVWIGWRDCFVRRIHGEQILGDLWPRLRATYLEQHEHLPDCAGSEHAGPSEAKDTSGSSWTAAIAAGAWSDTVLEYWRGCTPILRVLLTCPVFWQNHRHFYDYRASEGFVKRRDPLSESPWFARILPRTAHEDLREVWKKCRSLPLVVGDELAIERTPIAAFSPLERTYHSVLCEGRAEREDRDRSPREDSSEDMGSIPPDSGSGS